MIKNPSQYQINLAIESDDYVVARELTGFIKLFDKFMKKLLNITPNMVTYKNKKYDSRLVVIYSKEEMYSFIHREIDGTLHNKKNPNIKISRMFDVDANINFVVFELGEQVFKIDFFDLYNLLDGVKIKYNSMIENPESTKYQEVIKSSVSKYKDDEYEYEFLNGFHLDLVTVQNMKSQNIKIHERTFGVETDEFKTEDEAYQQLSDILKARIEVAISNPILDDKKLLRRKRIGENHSIEV